MRYINVDDDFVGKILAANQLTESKDLNESQEVEVVEEACEEGHVCPLCESELDEPISEQAMKECVDFILGTINEALEQDGEFLEEAEDEDEDEDEDDDKDDDKKKNEDYEVGSDDDEDERNEKKEKKGKKDK
ncbi:MAG: hypothetical protein CL605_02545 [Altibacter sp.]|uniref:hypothetical protein n=1 Tax=Altibacter sp. TaxID=2024823 RepID=UPI000C93B0DC|nr:hypothetical protein [Altibacter sp.]MAP53761.1 hypothetical protein [Altibacter sp.]|tara:strand:+ start:34441 stop:34839 length:399 start_codon:yes stop_codon:yes gene_type:complete